MVKGRERKKIVYNVRKMIKVGKNGNKSTDQCSRIMCTLRQTNHCLYQLYPVSFISLGFARMVTNAPFFTKKKEVGYEVIHFFSSFYERMTQKINLKNQFQLNVNFSLLELVEKETNVRLFMSMIKILLLPGL